MILIQLNGTEIKTSSNTRAELITEKEIPLNKVAIEVDGEIIPKSQLDNYLLKSNCTIEIITFVGGG